MSPVKEIMEDTLRIAAEKGRNIISVPMLKEDIIATEELLTDAIYELEKEGLARVKNDKVILTRKGREKAEDIFTRHEIVESYFHDILEDPMPHNAAHALEHFVSDEVVRKMRKFLTMKKRGKSISEFLPGEKMLIVAIEIADKRIFEKIIGLGLTPGSRLTVEEEISDAVILNVGGRKVALAKEIAKNILAVGEDEGY